MISPFIWNILAKLFRKNFEIYLLNIPKKAFHCELSQINKTLPVCCVSSLSTQLLGIHIQHLKILLRICSELLIIQSLQACNHTYLNFPLLSINYLTFANFIHPVIITTDYMFSLLLITDYEEESWEILRPLCELHNTMKKFRCFSLHQQKLRWSSL